MPDLSIRDDLVGRNYIKVTDLPADSLADLVDSIFRSLLKILGFIERDRDPFQQF
jgi:hypothetical protein